MRRVVSLYLPTWPTDRLRRRLAAAAPSPEAPLVLVRREGGRRLVFAADVAAQRLGLRPGMAASQAQALVPNLAVFEAEPVADKEALHRLALWAQRLFSPVVAADPPDGLLIDATGAAHLKGGEAAFIDELVARLQASAVAARAVMAATYGAAHALARYRARPMLVVCNAETNAALCDLPIAALRLDPATVDALHRLGFERIGELAVQPRAPLALRFGPELGRRLDQAFGRAAEPVDPVVAPELVQATRGFAEPISAPETITRYLSRLTAELCVALEDRGLGARRLDLLCHRVDNSVAAVRIGTAKPVRDVKRLTRLLAEKIETIDPGFGIERMTLIASIAEPLDYRPAATELGEAPAPDIAGLIDTLANRVGARRLYRVVPVESDLPERSVCKVAPLALPVQATWRADWPRPVRLFEQPEPVDTLALLPDHPPVAFTWRGIRRRVTRADGPERIFGEWWMLDTVSGRSLRDPGNDLAENPCPKTGFSASRMRNSGPAGRISHDAETASVRDYFQVEDEAGQRFWLFRAGDGEDAATGSQRWFIHGIFA